MAKKSSRKLYTALAVAAVSTASLTPAAVTEAAPKASVVKAKSGYVYKGDLDAALDATYKGAPIYWYKSSVDLEKLGTFQTARGIVKEKACTSRNVYASSIIHLKSFRRLSHSCSNKGSQQSES